MLPSKYELRPFFSFMVDDMIFFRDLNVQTCMLTLEESASSYAIHLKLSPNICYSHTNNKLITLPKFEPAEVPRINVQADIAQIVSQHSASSSGSRNLDDENAASSSVGSGLFSQTGGFEGAGAASASIMRASHGSSLGGYVEREGMS